MTVTEQHTVLVPPARRSLVPIVVSLIVLLALIAAAVTVVVILANRSNDDSRPTRAPDTYPASMPMQGQIDAITLDVESCTPAVDCDKAFSRAGAAASELQIWFNAHGDTSVGNKTVVLAEANYNYSLCNVQEATDPGSGGGCFTEAQTVQDDWKVLLRSAKDSAVH